MNAKIITCFDEYNKPVYKEVRNQAIKNCW